AAASVSDDAGASSPPPSPPSPRSDEASGATGTGTDAPASAAAASSGDDDDDAGSSRLFQPHRTLGLLTAASPRSGGSGAASDLASPSASLFRSRAGKFHLQPPSTSSDDAFVTVPIGDRFQIVTVSKLVPVLVSRALPPSAAHHRGGKKANARPGASRGGGEEELHRAISDASLSITVATHGPKALGRAVSVALYARTRPIASLDAFPFLEGWSKEERKKRGRWGIADVVLLGKRRAAMSGEKEGKTENALLLALVCALGDAGASDEGKGAEEGDGDVKVVGHDSEDESESESSHGDDGDDDSDDDDDDDNDNDISLDSAEGEDAPPAPNCHGRIILVQASRTTLEILKVVDLAGPGANFVPHVGLHPATYVNKILLGGRTAEEATAEDATSLLLVNVRSGKVVHSFRCLADDLKRASNSAEGPSRVVVTALAQSPAVDTVAVGMSDGSAHLVNLLHDVKLFTLRHTGERRSMRNKRSFRANAVSSLSFRTDGNAARQGVAPLAVGTDDGSVSVWDLTPVEDEGGSGTVRRTLLTRMEFVHPGGVSELAYLPGEPLLLSTGLASNAIVLHVFDAPDHSGRVLRQRRGHASPPALLRYLHPGAGGGGILANAADGTDASSCQVLSCGGRGDPALRMFSAARSNLDREYGQGLGLEKRARKLGRGNALEGRAELLLPQITGLATGEARGRDWGDLVTIHKDHAMAYVWSTKRGAQSGPVLRQPQWNVSAMKDPPPRAVRATSVAVSACGNFALVGTRGGTVYKYNLQSGLPRGSFPRDAARPGTEEERRRKKGLRFAGDVGRTTRMLEKGTGKGGAATPADVDKAERDRARYIESEARRREVVARSSHADAVVGIAIDSLNRTVVTAGADAKLVLWNFVTHMPRTKRPLELPSPATRMAHVRDSDLAAIAMEDFGVAVFDCTSLAIVRYFGGSRCGGEGSRDSRRMGHTGPITDLNFGPDGRRLFTSSLDGSIRVWDVPTGLCVDWMSFSSPPTSLTLSPTGEFLATSHVGQLGISLWCDKSFFRMVLLDGTPSEPAKMNEPCPVAECEQEGANEALASAVPSGAAKKKELSFDNASWDEKTDDDSPPSAKEQGLITLSGLPPAHWKNLFHLELVKERNKPTEAPKKPPQAPFFLQWRSGLGSGTADEASSEKHLGGKPAGSDTEKKDATDGWDAVWSDDDEEGDLSDADHGGVGSTMPSQENQSKSTLQNKRKKVVHHRSKLAELLRDCSDATGVSSNSEKYSIVTSYLSKMGPSSIDVEMSSLCYGLHDLAEGLPLLHLAASWLLEACATRQSFEAINAYLHRFLHIHSDVITRIDQVMQEETGTLEHPKREESGAFFETIALLREKQREASNRLQGKMQHTVCLLRHLSRMV
ncbi:hypothetical protein ACHAWF_010216, partial [Thalassiosira exigua]